MKISLTVVEPVRDWRDGYAALEDTLLGAEQHGSDVAAKAPAPDGHPGLVQKWQRLDQIAKI